MEILTTCFFIFIIQTTETSEDFWWNYAPILRESSTLVRPTNVSRGQHHNRGEEGGLPPLRSPTSSQICDNWTTLSPSQLRLCHLYTDHMLAVLSGARLGMEECRRQFEWRRWNCTILEDDPHSTTTPVLISGSPENAFVSAVASAGVVHAISRACRDGEISGCGCSSRARPRGLDPSWEWGGCGDNAEYGYRFAGGFVDARERERNHPRHSQDLAGKLMNIHNNQVGRRAVLRRVSVACKCHGVSGSCSLRTCWNQLANFKRIGDGLMMKYDQLIKSSGRDGLTFNKPGTSLIVRQDQASGSSNRRRAIADKGSRKPGRDQLVFLEPSPDYCEPNPARGIAGTGGRRCRRGLSGHMGCDVICCGRGYNTLTNEVTRRCGCKFRWCCEVVCEQCTSRVETNVCK